MKIGLFADPHYSSAAVSCTTRRPSLSFGKIREAMEAFKTAGCALVLCLGDLTDDSGSKDANEEKTVELVTMIRSFGIPFFSLMGNHDCQNFTREEFDLLTCGACPPFTLPAGGRTLIFLDANYTSETTPYEAGKVDWTKTLVPISQLEKLKAVLSLTDVHEAIVFTHQNLEDSVQYQHVISNAAKVRAILEQSGKVKKVISGHYHAGSDNTVGGISYHTLAAVCEGEENPFEILEI